MFAPLLRREARDRDGDAGGGGLLGVLLVVPAAAGGERQRDGHSGRRRASQHGSSARHSGANIARPRGSARR